MWWRVKTIKNLGWCFFLAVTRGCMKSCVAKAYYLFRYTHHNSVIYKNINFLILFASF